MGWKSDNDAKIDPSGIKQHFTDISFKVHCCRYWKLFEWEFNNLSFPFWRLYYNTTEGAIVSYDGRRVNLNADKIVLIPPYTSFSTSLRNRSKEKLSGNRIESEEELAHLDELKMVDHLFIHFNLGFQYDTLHSAIYEFETDNQIKELADSIRLSLIKNHIDLNFDITLKIYLLILLLLSKIPSEQWEKRNIDHRVIRIINFIDRHYSESLSNDYLARQASMSPNSFLRLFKSYTGTTLQQFVQQKRIEKAVLMMHNSCESIEEISEKCGFSERQHFSKVFRRITGMSPAYYRKKQVI